MKLINLALFSLAAFPSPICALSSADHAPYIQKEAGVLNGTIPTAPARSSLQGPSLPPISFTEDGTPSSGSIAPGTFTTASASQQGTAPGPQIQGETPLVTGEPGTGDSLSTTSDETSLQISSIRNTAMPANVTTQSTVVVTTTASFDALNLVDRGQAAATRPTSATASNIRPVPPSSAVSVSASTNGNHNGFPASVLRSSEGNGDFLTLTLTRPEGFEPHIACISSTDGAIPTTWSVVYTSTTTFSGDPTEYVPPEPEVTILVTCIPAGLEGGKGKSRAPDSLTCTSVDDSETCTIKVQPSIVLTTAPTFISSKMGPETTFTFITTAKNPSVIFSPVSTPRYGHDPETRARFPHDKHTAAKPTAKPTNDQRSPNPPGLPRDRAQEPLKITYMITVAPTKIIINDETFTQEDPSETRRVTVSGAEFTINPSEVAGGGTVVDRPGNVGRSTMVPSSTEAGGLPVVVAPAGKQNVVVVGGTTFGVQATPVTAVVQGQTITIQPSAIVLPRQTISISRASPEQTEIVVAGGEMITAIGPSVVVIRSTTFTYGLASSTITKIVDDDTILIGPSGVSVRNITLGGPKAKTSDTTYEIAGGATITQAGASVVIVDGTSFTVGPGRGTTTMIFGGETITIEPSGVAVSTLTLPYPFGPTVIIRIDVPTTAAAPPPVASETRKNYGAAFGHVKTTTWVHRVSCIAIGVWVLGRLV